MAALERAARGVTVTKAVHICYGYGTADVKRWKSAIPLRRTGARRESGAALSHP